MKINEKGGGVILSYAQMILNVLIKFIYTPFLLRALGQSEYGLYSLVMSIVGYLSILDMGFGGTVTRYAVKYRTAGDKEGLQKLYGTLSAIYIIIGLLALLICIALSYFADNLFGRTMTGDEVEKLRLMIVLCGINLLFTFPLQISASVVVAHEKFVFKNAISLARVLLQPTILILLLYFVHIKSVGAIIVVTSFNFLTYLSYYIFSVIKLDFRFSLSKITPSLIPSLMSFSVWMFAIMVFDQLQYNMGPFVLGMFQSSEIVAIWGVAMIFVLNYRSLSTAITNVFMPSILSITFNDNREGLFSTIKRMTRLQALILVTILFNFILFGKQFLYLWAGEDYLEAYKCSLTVMIPMTFSLILEFCYLYQLAKNDFVYRIITSFGSLIVSFILVYCIFGINLQSFPIFMALSLVSGQVVFMCIYIERNKLANLRLIAIDLLKMLFIPLLYTALFYLVIHFLPLSNTLLSFIFKILVYNSLLLGVLWLFSLSDKEKAFVIKKQL